jgi:hypothetical protein
VAKLTFPLSEEDEEEAEEKEEGRRRRRRSLFTQSLLVHPATS